MYIIFEYKSDADLHLEIFMLNKNILQLRRPNIKITGRKYLITFSFILLLSGNACGGRVIQYKILSKTQFLL